MSMLEYNEIKEHKIIVWDGQPHEVLTSHVFRKQQRKPVNATKLKNLLDSDYSLSYKYDHMGEDL
jgi:translation elongation factor P/translation initiation factor 5A